VKFLYGWKIIILHKFENEQTELGWSTKHRIVFKNLRIGETLKTNDIRELINQEIFIKRVIQMHHQIQKSIVSSIVMRNK
jgi:hypothetical protein